MRHLRQHLKAHKDTGGFTLIELLVVVLIIGVLAAIAVPVFFGQVDNARQSAVDSAAVNGHKAALASLVNGDTTGAEAAARKSGTKDVDVSYTLDPATGEPCVTATWSDNSSITARKGACAAVGGETEEPGGGEDYSASTIASFSCVADTFYDGPSLGDEFYNNGGNIVLRNLTTGGQVYLDPTMGSGGQVLANNDYQMVINGAYSRFQLRGEYGLSDGCSISLDSWGEGNSVTSLAYAFGRIYSSEISYVANIPGTVTDTSEMFIESNNVTADIGDWNTSSVQNMSNMFNSSSFNQDISGWDVSSVTNHDNFSLYSGLSAANMPRF